MHPWDESINMVPDEANKKNISVLTPKIEEKIENIKKPTKSW